MALNYLAGGRNSPIPIPDHYPKDIVAGEGAWVINKDGSRYIDLWMGYGALLFGHAPKDIADVIANNIKNGWFFSYQTYIEKELAEIIQNIIPSAERIRFATTGSDAVAYAVRVSRAYTSRRKVLSINGGYHGVHEGMMPSQGIIEGGEPDRVAFNDIEAVERILKSNEYACFILEPILANAGCTPPQANYLKEIRRICDRTGTILIFDEIVTGFRIDLHGAQGFYNVTPDLSLFSKAISSGFPLSVICGKEQIMNSFMPSGNVFFAGTFNGNPLSLLIAKTVIEKLKDKSFYEKNQRIGDDFRNHVQTEIDRLRIKAGVQGIASMATLAFGCEKFERGLFLEEYDSKAYDAFIKKMAKRGVLMPPLPTETIFLSYVHVDVMDQIKSSIHESLTEMVQEGLIDHK
jgi:glutamate-1-semialdehyde 2,1-aminomutase